MIFYIWKKSNLDDEFTVGFNAGTRKTFWEMKRLIGKYGEKTIWKRFLEYKSSFHWNFHWKLVSNIESSFFWHFEGKLISAKEIWERICMFCANIPPQVFSSHPTIPYFWRSRPTGNHSCENIYLLQWWQCHACHDDWLAERQTAEELKKKMRGEEEDSKSVEVLHISVQLFIAVTLFMKKDEMSGGDKMIKR